MKTVYLHVGAHKTATTSIQFWCDGNRDALLQEGVLYPKAALADGEAYGRQKGHHLLPWSIRGQHGLCVADVWPELRREIDAATVPSVLLSSEVFECFTREQIARVAHELGRYRVEVITFLREPVGFLLSNWKQAIKADQRWSGSTRDYVEMEVRRCDYVAMARRWASEFGDEALHLVVYDRVRKHPGVLDALLAALGVARPSAGIAAPLQADNVSFSDRTTLALLALNRIEEALPRPLRCKALLERVRRSVAAGRRAGRLLTPVLATVTRDRFDERICREIVQHQDALDLSPLLKWLDGEDLRHLQPDLEHARTGR